MTQLWLSLALYIGFIAYTVGPLSSLDVKPIYWWACLSTACAFNFLVSVFKKTESSFAQRCAMIVSFCYLHRAIFMHCTVERDCFWDNKLCTSLWGRTVACTGEMTFVYFACSQLAPGLPSRVVVSLIAVAQTLSFIGVMKKHYYWFFFENSIWTVCAGCLAVHQFIHQKRKCYQSVPYLLMLFACYNVIEDLPMYLTRHQEKTHLPGYNLGLIEGALDALECTQVTQSFDVWKPQMLWQSLNYTIVPAACICLMFCGNSLEKEKNH